MTKILFRLVKIKQYKYCPSCRKFKHWRLFKRPQPGGILPMLVHEECNLCARVRAWYSSLTETKKRSLELKENDDDHDGEIGVCENCGERRYGEKRELFDGRWICNYCFWMHAFGRRFID